MEDVFARKAEVRCGGFHRQVASRAPPVFAQPGLKGWLGARGSTRSRCCLDRRALEAGVGRE